MKIVSTVMAGCLALFVAAPVFAANTTGQGIMVGFDAGGTYAITQENTYKFSKTAAAAYFTNSWDQSTPVTCSPTNKCPIGEVPPAAPAPDASQVMNTTPGKSDVVGKNQCIFLSGGALLGGSYTQTVDVGSNSQKHTYTYTYVIAPTVATVDPYTAWTLLSSTGAQTVHVDLNAVIAGESYVNNSNNSKVGLKYSFDMGTTDAPRVQALAVALNGAVIANPNVTVQYPVDFLYQTNAGTNGNTTFLTNGDARTILNTDGFSGNDNGGTNGAALALAKMDTVGLDLPVGQFTVTLTGIVKGNSATADLPITVSSTITVIAPGCM